MIQLPVDATSCQSYRPTATQETMPRGFSVNEGGGEACCQRKARRTQRFHFCVELGCFAFATLTLALLSVPVESSREVGCTTSESLRFNCIPEGAKLEAEDLCEQRGCCWNSSRSDAGAAICFYPEGFGYAVDGQVKSTPSGKMVYATRKPGQPSQYGGDIATVRVDFFYETPYRLRVKVHSFILFSAQLQAPPSFSAPSCCAAHAHLVHSKAINWSL